MREIDEDRNHLDRSGLCSILVDQIQERGLFAISPEGVILTWNAGAERIKQFTAEDAIGQHFRMLYLPEDVRNGRPERNLRDALNFGKTQDIGWRRRKDGTQFWAEAHITAIYDAAGEHVGFAKDIRDLSEPNRAEQHARQVALRRELDVMKDELLAVISHELRTPLAAIRGYADLIDEELVGPLTPDQHRFVKEIIRGAERLGRQIDDVLDVAQAAGGRLGLSLAPLDMAEVTEAVLRAVQPEALRKDLWLANHVTHDLPPVLGDAHRVGQMLFHLVENAVKFANAQGRVEISCVADDGWLRCEVRDDGDGITPAQLEAMFDRFRQGDMSATRSKGGLGLGLHLARAIAEAHGGELGVMSEPGQGSRFWFSLPLAPAAVGQA